MVGETNSNHVITINNIYNINNNIINKIKKGGIKGEDERRESILLSLCVRKENRERGFEESPKEQSTTDDDGATAAACDGSGVTTAAERRRL